MPKFLSFAMGFILVIIGIVLVLRQWSAVVTVFQGVIGGAMAVAGLVILFASTLKRND